MLKYTSHKGNTAATYNMPLMAIDGLIDYYIITNKSVGAITLNVYVVDINGVPFNICPKDLQLANNESFTDRKLPLLKGEILRITVSGGNADFFISKVWEQV